MTMTLIETKTLGTAASTIEFVSIPQDGTDLLILVSGRTDRSAAGDSVLISFNGSTTGFTSRYLEGNGSSVSSATDTRLFANVTGATQTANTFGNFAAYIPNYSGSTNKSYSTDYVQENNATTSFMGILAGLWSNTAAITSFTLSLGTGPNFVVGTTVSLYKITKGSSGGVVVS